MNNEPKEQFDCDFVRDLLPAYAGQSASARTNAIVEGHIPNCPPCREELESLRESDARALQIGRGVLEKYNRKRSKKYRRSVLLTVLLSLVGVIGIAALLFGVRVPVTLTLDDMELCNDVQYNDNENPTERMLGFHMQYFRRPWAKYVGEITSHHYDEATGTLIMCAFYNVSPRLVDVLLSPIFPPGQRWFGYPSRYDGFAIEDPLTRGEDGQLQPKYRNVIWKVYYYQHRDEDLFLRTLFPDGHNALRESLLDGEGNLKPEIAEIATLLWEGPVEFIADGAQYPVR